MARHYVEVCTCGAVIAQCRCTSPNKVKRVVPAGCRACRGGPAGGPVFPIAVYKSERDAGLDEVIRSSARVSLACAARAADPCDVPEVRESVLSRVRSIAREFASAADNDFDLYHLTTILVTVGWNKNDDVFDGVETWVARKTPEDKQLNYEHDDSKIVGHITSNWVVDADGKVVPDDTAADDLPAKFHVATAAVLYKCWQTPELQKRADELIAQIAKGEWYVSMECLFKGFDYALRGSDGSTRVVARNEKTAFLSKHLRCYGGTGKYEDYRVGRLLRNIVFSGKGLVRNPANPESVILSSDPSAAAGSVQDFSCSRAEQVYSLPTHEGATTKQESHQVMTITVEQVQAQLAEAKAEIDRLKASQTETVVADLKAKVAAAEKAAADAQKSLASTEQCLAEANDSAQKAANESAKTVEALKAELGEAKAKVAEMDAELKTLHADKLKLSRVSAVKEKLGLDEAAAAEFVADHIADSDEAFAKTVEFIAKTVAAKAVTNNPQSGNTNFSGATPKAAPKATGKPTAPKATGNPAPMAGKAAEVDEEGEEAAEAADLEAAEAEKAAALATSVTDSGVTETQKAIAAAFGCDLGSD